MGAHSTRMRARQRGTVMAGKLFNLKGRLASGPYVTIPRAVLESPAFMSRSANSKRLLFDLMAGFRFGHNGDIAATRTIMRRRGWTSNSSLQSAINELLAAGLIELTRQGGLHRCSLFAFTWMAIDACEGKLDVRPTATPSSLWQKFEVSGANEAPAFEAGHIAPVKGPSKPSPKAQPVAVGLQTGPTTLSPRCAVARDKGTFEFTMSITSTAKRLLACRTKQLEVRGGKPWRPSRAPRARGGGMEKSMRTAAAGHPLRL